MRGAFLVGALKKFYQELGPNYFDAIFATSVGVFEQAFFASGQIFTMENTWREYVNGRKLINPLNPIKGRAILDLDYLTDLFQSEKSMLDVKAMKDSHPKLITFITKYDTREPIAVDLKTENVFEVMKATCALPLIYPRKVMIEGSRYVDSWMASQEKFKEVLREKLKDYDEIVAVVTYTHYDKVLGDIKKILRPKKMPLWGAFDTNKKRLIQTIEQGEKDATEFLVAHQIKMV